MRGIITAFRQGGKEHVLAEKDITEKLLEDYGDVFSDIVNGFIFYGKPVVTEDELTDIHTVSQYKAFDGKLHGEERDVAKCWKHGVVNIAVLGIENQSEIFASMPLRVIGYDGASYRSQLTEYDSKVRAWKAKRQDDDMDVNTNRSEFHPVPVLTIVLYFGIDHWTRNLRLKELLDIPAEMDRFINDYRINVFEISWLSDEQISMFKSDFRIVADFFSKKRRNPDYIPDNPTEILHVDEVLKFISAVTKDRRYEAIIEDDSENKEVRTMCDVAERLEQRGIAKGITQGERLGVIKTLKELVTDKILTVSDAAKRAGMSVSDFKTAAGIIADR